MASLQYSNKEPKELRPRAAFMGVVVTLLFLLIVGRLYHLQLVRGEELSLKSRDNYVKELVEPADRGLIFDRRGRTLADNRPSFDVYLTPAFCRARDEVIGRLALILNLSQEELDAVNRNFDRARGLERFRPFLVKLDISRDQVDVVEADLSLLEGVDIIPSPHRDYPYGPLLAHVVGYLSEVSQAEFEEGKGKYRRGDYIGRRGLERTFESYLRGVDGKRRIAVDARGRALDASVADMLIPEESRRIVSEPGNNVVLSLDLGLQHIADQALAQGALAGSVVVVDVHTGYVLAMVSAPSYDPNKMTARISRSELQAINSDPMEPLFQRAIQQHYHPGSTFKPFTALAGLKEEVAHLGSSTSCNGGYTLGRRRWRCWLDRGHGGGINLQKSLSHSCDVYYYWIADRMGLEPIADMAFQFGFGKPTGIELRPEAAGLIPTPEFHRRVDGAYTRGLALNAAIGQGSVNVTPLQLAMGYAALANGGVLYKPRLVRRVESPDKEVLVNQLPEVVRKLDIPQAQLNAVMQGLDEVVNLPGATAYSRRLSGIRVAGKTGTAQVVALGDRRRKLEEMPWKERDHAWFAAIAPADEPEIAVVVLNEHGGGGSTAAAPIAMAVVQGYFDLKAQEEEQRSPLSPEAVMAMEPNPRFAWPQKIRPVVLPPEEIEAGSPAARSAGALVGREN